MPTNLPAGRTSPGPARSTPTPTARRPANRTIDALRLEPGLDRQRGLLSPSIAPADATAVSMPQPEATELLPEKGQLTYKAEGSNDPANPFYSRRLHWPGGASGVTLGRGYDLSQRRTRTVQADLQAAGLDEALARRISAGVGKTGRAARDFVNKNKDIEISEAVQVALFAVSYGAKEGSAADCLERWSGLDLATLAADMREILVDLFFRGDLTKSKWDTHGLAAIVRRDDMEAMLRLLRNRRLWPGIDTNRYRLRVTAATRAPQPPR
jgi:hypothetical protein